MNKELYIDYLKLQEIVIEDAKTFGYKLITKLMYTELPFPEDIFNMYINRYDAQYIEENLNKVRYAKTDFYILSASDIKVKLDGLNIEYEVPNIHTGNKTTFKISRQYFIDDDVDTLIQHYQNQWDDFNKQLITNEYILNKKKLHSNIIKVDDDALIKVEIGGRIYNLYNSFEQDKEGNVIMKIITDDIN